MLFIQQVRQIQLDIWSRAHVSDSVSIGLRHAAAIRCKKVAANPSGELFGSSREHEQPVAHDQRIENRRVTSIETGMARRQSRPADGDRTRDVQLWKVRVVVYQRLPRSIRS